MSFTDKTIGNMSSYLNALSLPPDIKGVFTNITDRWLVDNGPEWSVDRMKSIYTDFIRFHSGLPCVSPWVKKNRKGIPSGIFSRIFLYSKRSPKCRFECGVLLRKYTKLISNHVTSKQRDKFLSGVLSSGGSLPDDIALRLADCAKSYKKDYVLPRPPSYVDFKPSSSRRVRLHGRSVPEDEGYQQQWIQLSNTEVGRRLERSYHSIFSHVFKGFLRMRIGGPTMITDEQNVVGSIGLIQEPGYKLRAVANPNRVYQVALKPFGDSIYNLLRLLPYDCTFDQDRATPYIQDHLKKGGVCHSVDLSGATDNFPLSVQMIVLRTIFHLNEDYLGLFQDLSTSQWLMEGKPVVWSRGQPLGLYPSFGAFALTHGLLLQSLRPYKPNSFFVLGDDVVILDDLLYKDYIKVLSLLNCPISSSKSISSNKMAEFGGKLITSESSNHQLKWRDCSDDNFLEVVKLLGMKAIMLLRPKQRKVARLLCDIPDFVGGAGLNPDGLPLKDRYEKYLTLFGEDDGAFLMSYDRARNDFFYKESKLTLSNDELTYIQMYDGSPLPDLDQRSSSLVEHYIPALKPLYKISGKNLFSVLGSSSDVLPIDGIVSRQSFLQSMMKKLRI